MVPLPDWSPSSRSRRGEGSELSLSPAFLDELRARVPLSPVVGRRVKLTRAGREWKGCCPFHNEKTPSFYVNDDKGFYHCFGCGAHGDVIRFLTDQEGLPFMDAVKQLAAQAGHGGAERHARSARAGRGAGWPAGARRAGGGMVCGAAEEPGRRCGAGLSRSARGVGGAGEGLCPGLCARFPHRAEARR